MTFDPYATDLKTDTWATRQNLVNLAVLLLVPLPSIIAVALAEPACAAAGSWCGMVMTQPVVAVNVLFFVNVCVLFWLIALVQRSTWLIDPYWTIIPLFIAHFYVAHPFSNGDPTREVLAVVLLWVWSIRLTHNYFRRERWQLGAREDWRFAKKRREWPRHFWWIQFFYAYVSQHFMLVGLTLPFWAIAFRPAPLDALDVVLAAGALAGIVVAHLADTTLHTFMEANRDREARGEAKVELLEEGVWRYSRHPNHFGEQLFWWCIAGYGMRLGEAWTVAGTAFNTSTLIVVMIMVERRIMQRESRRELYAAYRRRVAFCIPWFRRGTR